MNLNNAGTAPKIQRKSIRTIRVIVPLLLLAASACPARADLLTTTWGEKVTGTVINVEKDPPGPDYVWLKPPNGPRDRYAITQIRVVETNSRARWDSLLVLLAGSGVIVRLATADGTIDSLQSRQLTTADTTGGGAGNPVTPVLSSPSVSPVRLDQPLPPKQVVDPHLIFEAGQQLEDVRGLQLWTLILPTAGGLVFWATSSQEGWKVPGDVIFVSCDIVALICGIAAIVKTGAAGTALKQAALLENAP